MMVKAGGEAIKYKTITSADLKLHKRDPERADLKRRLLSTALIEVHIGGLKITSKSLISGTT